MRRVDSLQRLWCCGGLGAGGKGDNRGWDGWMASPTWWTWVWVNSGSWWWTGRPGVLQFMGSQRVGHDWATELNWTEPWKASAASSLTLREGELLERGRGGWHDYSQLRVCGSFIGWIITRKKEESSSCWALLSSQGMRAPSSINWVFFLLIFLQ